jgi:hypothetical protein
MPTPTLRAVSPTRKDIEHFELIAAYPHTAEIMKGLGHQLCCNFDTPARTILEITGNKLGLRYDEIEMFQTWWNFDHLLAQNSTDPAFRCLSCRRPEGECSANPCAAVIDDREATIEDVAIEENQCQ